MSAGEHVAQMQRVVWVTHRSSANVLLQGVPSASMHRYDAFFGASRAWASADIGGYMGAKSATASRPANVHVHLYYGVDPSRYRKDENVGCLYGYHYAESESMALSYSQDHPEGRVVRTIRRGLKAFLGCDLIHAFRNRAALLEADVIWTHTEREYLSVALLLMLKRGPRNCFCLRKACGCWISGNRLACSSAQCSRGC